MVHDAEAMPAHVLAMHRTRSCEGAKNREVGTHEELMARQGFYFQMVERQQQQLGRLETVQA